MEAVIERIATNVGSKWVELYSHLGLGPRDRYRFLSNHEGEPEHVKVKNCARDSIRLWRSSKCSGDVEEREVMRRLLLSLRKTKGFSDLAEELAHSNGIVLDPPQVPETQSAPVAVRSHSVPSASRSHDGPQQPARRVLHKAQTAPEPARGYSDTPHAEQIHHSPAPLCRTHAARGKPVSAQPPLSAPVMTPECSQFVAHTHHQQHSHIRPSQHPGLPLPEHQTAPQPPFHHHSDRPHTHRRHLGPPPSSHPQASSAMAPLPLLPPSVQVVPSPHSQPVSSIGRRQPSQLQPPQHAQPPPRKPHTAPVQHHVDTSHDQPFHSERDDQMLHTARPPHQADLPPSPAAQPQASPIHSQAISPGSFHHSVPDGGSSLRPVGLEATVGLQHAEEEEELKMSRSSSSVSQLHMDSSSDSEPLHSVLNSQALHQNDLEQPDVEQLLQCPINLTETRHKFAVLDLAQRLTPQKWHAIGTRLELSQHFLQEIEKEKQPEERYYLVLKEWVTHKGTEATFASLTDILESFEEAGATDLVTRRLQSTGMTLS